VYLLDKPYIREYVCIKGKHGIIAKHKHWDITQSSHNHFTFTKHGADREKVTIKSYLPTPIVKPIKQPKVSPLQPREKKQYQLRKVGAHVLIATSCENIQLSAYKLEPEMPTYFVRTTRDQRLAIEVQFRAVQTT